MVQCALWHCGYGQQFLYHSRGPLPVEREGEGSQEEGLDEEVRGEGEGERSGDKRECVCVNASRIEFESIDDVARSTTATCRRHGESVSTREESATVVV